MPGLLIIHLVSRGMRPISDLDIDCQWENVTGGGIAMFLISDLDIDCQWENVITGGGIAMFLAKELLFLEEIAVLQRKGT